MGKYPRASADYSRRSKVSAKFSSPEEKPFPQAAHITGKLRSAARFESLVLTSLVRRLSLWAWGAGFESGGRCSTSKSNSANLKLQSISLESLSAKL